MRRNSLLQKFLYIVIAVLGVYLLVKGGGLLAARDQLQKALDDGNVQRSLEDSAMRTWATGYTATVEGKKNSNWLSRWMQQIAPVFSYAVDQAAEEEESVNTARNTENESIGWNTEKESDTLDTDYRTGGNDAEQILTESGENIGEAEKDTELILVESEENIAESEEAGAETATDGKESDEISTESEDLPIETERNEIQMQETEQYTPEDKNFGQNRTINAIFSEALTQLSDYSYLLSNYYTVDADTSVDEELLDADELLSIDLSIEQDPEVPQILIYHTHSQEAFSDSEEGEVSDTVVGMGEILSDELRRYGYNVIHDTGMYDLVDGVLDRSAAYDYARASIEEILEENPTIEVIIDLHRDGVNGTEEDFVTEVDGKAVSRIMFFNGLSRDAAGEALSWLPNSYVKENLAFSLQLQVLANAEYSGFTRKIYLQAERYNLHLRARSLLIEAGTQMNTVAEEQNAMALIANLLQQLLNQ